MCNHYLHCHLICHPKCLLYTDFHVPFHLQYTLLTTWLQHHYDQAHVTIWIYPRYKLINWETPFSSSVDKKTYLRPLQHLKWRSLWHFSLFRNTCSVKTRITLKTVKWYANQISWLASASYEFSLKSIFEQIIVNDLQTLSNATKNFISQAVGDLDTSRYSYTCYYI